VTLTVVNGDSSRTVRVRLFSDNGQASS
jgi:hypothetical protein